MSGEPRKFELSIPQIVGSALAAVTAAVAASYLGVAGTVIGAAVVSIASTVATAVYTHYLKRTEERVKQRTLVIRWQPHEPAPGEQKPDAATPGAGTPDSATTDAPTPDAPTPDAPTPDATTEGGSRETTLVMPVAEQPRRRVSWVKVAGAAVIVFAVSMGGILAYQGITRQTLHEQVTGKVPHQARVQHEPPSRQEVRVPSHDTPQPTVTYGPSKPSPTPTPTPSRSADAGETPPPSGRPTEEPEPQRSDDVVEPSHEATSPPPLEERPGDMEEAPTPTAPSVPQEEQTGPGTPQR
ncbi:hypothetical protein E1286_26665 [Nonomuraea terrae]|uniref:Uncharacterized protein n=1 Tax=Nonomuraea terrae TaxID=2530383 RepID=A0A4V6PDS6_9ACTN|nr:hypothetical protein [Nonomuraea terrae]TDD44607.1 hypothetical protein E1286_26665 [Nonomuraea terrae]